MIILPPELASSHSCEIQEIHKQSADFTPYITQVLPLKSKKSLSPTKVVSSKHSYFIQQQTSEDILSPIFDILSQRPVRSPEKKFEYVQGNPQLAHTAHTFT